MAVMAVPGVIDGDLNWAGDVNWAGDDRRRMPCHRWVYGIAIAVTVALGLASRMKTLGWPAVFEVNAGDVLSATCIYFGVRFWWWRRRVVDVACLSFTICALIEIQQLYQAPWAVKVRNNRIVGTFLGHGFLWIDLVRYAIGVTVGVGIGVAIEAGTARARLSRDRRNTTVGP